MRASFLLWFEKNYPGCSPEGSNGVDAWEIWQEAFLSGVMYMALSMKENPLYPEAVQICTEEL
jgi:hypothetical protein